MIIKWYRICGYCFIPLTVIIIVLCDDDDVINCDDNDVI